MSTNNNSNVHSSPLTNKNKLLALIEALEVDLLVNENKLEEVLKDASCYDNYQLECQINKCFKLRCKLEDYLNELKQMKFKCNCPESTNTLVNFVATVSHNNIGFGPRALVLVTSTEVEKLYTQLLQRLALDNVIVVTIGAMTECNFHMTLMDVKTVLLDGSQEAYAEFVGSESVRLIVSMHVPADRLFTICNDVHREECIREVLRGKFTRW